MMKKIVGILLFTMIAAQVQGAYLLIDGSDPLAVGSPIELSGGTHTLTWGGTETGNPTPGEWWDNGIIFIQDVGGNYPSYFTGEAAFNGVKAWQSAAGSGTWVSFVGGTPSDEARVYLPAPMY